MHVVVGVVAVAAPQDVGEVIVAAVQEIVAVAAVQLVAGNVVAAAAQLVMSALSPGPPYPTVGASGGVFGLLLGFAMYFPHRTIVLLIPPVPMPAWLFVTLFGMLELYLGVTGTQAGIAHFAHLGGMLGAWVLIQYWRTRPPRR